MIETVRNIPVKGKHQRPIVTDVFYRKTGQPKSIVIFAHGYKGYKDWGCWNLVAEQFAQQELFFVKFNFSHNGGTLEQPIDFPDLEAFGHNNYTKELDDLQSVIDWVLKDDDFSKEIKFTDITLIGHSRGGGIVTLKANEEPRVNRLISWAAVSNFAQRSSTIGELEAWKKNGVKYVLNGRTKQQMPHFYQFYKDFKANETRFNIERAARNINIPHFIIHGTKDTSISFEEARNLHKWNPESTLLAVDEADHVFGSKHPWQSQHISEHLAQVVNASINFIKH